MRVRRWSWIAATLLAALMSGRNAVAQAVQANTITVRGLLLDELGRPAADVPVSRVLDGDHDYRRAIAAPITRSGKDGLFVAEVERSVSRVTWLLVGGKRFALHRRELPFEATDLTVDPIALARGFAATGRVRTSDGGDPSKAWVVGTDMLAGQSHPNVYATQMPMQCASEATVGRGGVFVLPGMLRSAGRIVVRCEGYFDAVIRPVAMEVPIRVTLHPSRTVRGHVKDNQGRPVANADIYAPEWMCRSDANGAFEFALRDPTARQVTTHCERAGISLHGQSPLPASDDDPLELTAAGDDAPRVIRVHARACDGTRLQAFQAFLHCDLQRNPTLQPEALRIDHARRRHGGDADTANGVAHLVADHLGDTATVYVRATGHGWGRQSLAFENLYGTDPIEVTMTAPCKVVGRVVDSTTGEPIAGATIVAMRELNDRLRARFAAGRLPIASVCEGPDAVRADADGRWHFDALPPGEVDLFVCIDGFPIGAAEHLELRAGEQLLPVELALPSRRTLSGRVVGSCPPGTQLRLHWHREGIWRSSWETDRDGAIHVRGRGPFAFRDVPPLHYDVQLLLPPVPRNGYRYRVVDSEWVASNQPRQELLVDAVDVTTVSGTVDGPVPWHRLAVYVQGKSTYRVAPRSPAGQLAPVDPERHYRIQLPKQDLQFSLIDVLTGVVFARRIVRADALDQPIEWSGAAHPIRLSLHEHTEQVRNVKVRYEPLPQARPPRRRNDLGIPFSRYAQMVARSNERCTVYVPDPSGHITVIGRRDRALVDIGVLESAGLTIDIDDDRVRLRQ